VSRKIAARPPEETALDLIFFALSGGASTLITV
jgi:glycerate-2-kinase